MIKDKIRLETNEAYLKILYWFYSFPNKKIGLNELVKELKISKSTASRTVDNLIQKGIITREIIGKSWILELNRDNPKIKLGKISYNLALIYDSGIIDEINKKYGPISIILFGSYRKGDDTEKSDIDLAVEISGDKSLKIEKFTELKHFGYRKNVSVNLHIFSRRNINDNLFSNIANGIILDGFLEVASGGTSKK
ncbi:MAG: nucleotidyltransferase domain-containing protein [Nanoarchaeota archaeon]